MILFLLVYLSIYGGVHIYAFLKLKRGLTLGLPAYSILAIFMILMVVAPIVVRISERYGYEAFARGLAYVGFTWMGLIFIFISASFFFDIYRLFHFLARMLTQRPPRRFYSFPKKFLYPRHFILFCRSDLWLLRGASHPDRIRNRENKQNTRKNRTISSCADIRRPPRPYRREVSP